MSDEGEPGHAADVVGADPGQRLGWDEWPSSQVSDDPVDRGYRGRYDTPRGLQPRWSDKSRGDDSRVIAVGHEGASAPAIIVPRFANPGTAYDVDSARAIAAVIAGISYHAILPGQRPFMGREFVDPSASEVQALRL